MTVQVDDVQIELAAVGHQYCVIIPIQSLEIGYTENTLARQENMTPAMVANNGATYDVTPYFAPHIIPTVAPTPATPKPLSWTALLIALLLIWVRPVKIMSSLVVSPFWYATLPVVFTLLVFYTHDFMLVFLGAPSSEGEFVRGVFGILLGWPLCAGLLQLLSRTVRPQPPLPPIVALSAWALLPLAARNLVELLSMIVNGEAVTHHGLSGLLIGDHAIIDLASAWMHASVYTLFSFVDLYTFLHIFLLVLTIRIAIAVTTGKAILITTLYGVIVIAASLGMLLVEALG